MIFGQNYKTKIINFKLKRLKRFLGKVTRLKWSTSNLKDQNDFGQN